MADPHQSLLDLAYGYLGPLTYISNPNPERHGPGQFQTSRRLEKRPAFRFLTEPETWVPAENVSDPDPPPEPVPSIRARRQERWLLATHPSAFVATGVPIRHLLAEDLSQSANPAGPPATLGTSLLGFGQMTDFGAANRSPTGAQLLATPAGTSGETLRLVRIQPRRLTWHPDLADGADQTHQTHQTVEAWELDLEDAEDETHWTADVLPISKIKFATSLTRFDPLRWLLVQKQTGTTILRPEYHDFPKPSERDPARIGPARPSRIGPKRLATITALQTGRNIHTDLAFNPPRCGTEPAQIAIIDQCGYWTVWSIHLWKPDRGVAHSSPQRIAAGHMTDGFLREIPHPSSHLAENHGIIWIGGDHHVPNWVDNDDDNASSTTTAAAAAETGVAVPARTLLTWNPSNISIFDVPSMVCWPIFAPLLRSRGSQEKIRDIQVCPADKNHVLILTTRHLVWLDMFPAHASSEPARRVPSIIVRSPHLWDESDNTLGFTACREQSESGKESVIVLLYSALQKDLCAYWLWPATDRAVPQHHRHIISSAGLTSRDSFGSRSLCIVPLSAPPASSEPGAAPSRQQGGVQFHQLLSLGQDMSVRSTICATFIPSVDIGDVAAPTGPTGTSFGIVPIGRFRNRRRRQKWTKFVRRVESAFVVPDGLGDLTLIARPPRPNTPIPESVVGGRGPEQPRERRLRKMKFGFLAGELRMALGEVVAGGADPLSLRLFESVRAAILAKRDAGHLPLQSLFELAGAFAIFNHNNTLDMNDWEEGLRSILDLSREGVSVLRISPRSEAELEDGRVDISLLAAKMGRIWLDTLSADAPEAARRRRRIVTSQLAVAALLCSYGVMIPPAVSEMTKPSSAHPAPPPSSSSQLSSSSFSVRKRKKSSGSAAHERSALAISRLRALAGSIDENSELARTRQSPVLAHWPDELGVPIDDYVSSVAESSDRKSGGAEAKRRRLAAERYKFFKPAAPGPGGPAGPAERHGVESVASRAPPIMVKPDHMREGGGAATVVLLGPPAIASSRSDDPLIAMSGGGQVGAEGWQQSESLLLGASPTTVVMSQPSAAGGGGMGSLQPVRAAVVMSQPSTGAFGDSRRRPVVKKGPQKIRGFR